MPIPNPEGAQIDKRKLTNYLLNPGHPDAEGKGAFFVKHYGSDWKQLRDDLLSHASGVTAKTEKTPYGTVYVIEGELFRPVRAVWIVREGEDFPRLVTAYPTD